MEEVSIGFLEVALSVHIGGISQIGHDVSLAHVGNLLWLDDLTGEGIDRFLERLLIRSGDLAPHFKRRRPRIQAENRSKPRRRDFLGLFRRVNGNRSIVPDHSFSSVSLTSHSRSASLVLLKHIGQR